MENYNPHKHFLPFLCFFLLLLSGQQEVEASDHDHNVNVDGDDHDHDHDLVYSFYPTKLFVFGDSYSDTGNTDKSKPYNCWKYPYGITFPGKPTGRFSDGRIFTDYLAKFVGMKSPLTYQQWRKGGKLLKYGMNFAYAGTGVFDTLLGGPNLTTQIDLFQKLIKESVFTTTDLHSSLALITIAGNDCSTFEAKIGSSQDYLSFFTAMVNQTCLNLKYIQDLGVKIIAVSNFPPIGCLPQLTAKTSFQHCNETINELANLHNDLLRQAVAELNNVAEDSPFLLLDLYASFMSIFEKKGHPLGGAKFENLLKPCCVGTSSEDFCGSLDQSGNKKYTICDNPKSALFWDDVHPTQQGWNAVYSALQPTLYQIFELNRPYFSS